MPNEVRPGRYRGDPSWVMMDVVAPGFTGVYHCEVQLADGAIVTARSVAVHHGTGEWAGFVRASLWPPPPFPNRDAALPILAGMLAGVACYVSSALTPLGTAPWPARPLPRAPR
jgi:hypothetical protein